MRILVVDDDPDLVSAISTALAAEGHHVLTAKDGREALALLYRVTAPDVILLDIVMPVMDGVTFLRMKGEDARVACVPVVAMSAQSLQQLDGVAGLLQKPFDIDELLSALAVPLAARS